MTIKSQNTTWQAKNSRHKHQKRNKINRVSFCIIDDQNIYPNSIKNRIPTQPDI